MNGAKQDEGSGHGRQSGRQPKRPAEQSTAGKHSLLNRHCRQTQPADSPSSKGLKTNSQQLAGFAAKTQQLPDDVVLPFAVQVSGWAECSGVGTQEGGCRPA